MPGRTTGLGFRSANSGKTSRSCSTETPVACTCIEDIENKNRTQEFKTQNTFGAYNEYRTEIEKTELKVEDLEDEFDHTK